MKKSTLFYITLFLLIMAYTISTNKIDWDLWARLIAGMGVIDGGHVLKQDFLSYTPVHTWYDHEWGAGVIFYAVLKYFGENALIILQCVLDFLVFFIATKVVKLRTGITDYNILYFYLCFVAAITNFNQLIRSHMFSFVLFALFIYILEKVRHGGNNKWLIALPFLTIIWNNIHGGVVAGLGLIAMYIAGEILNRKPYKNYIITLAASSLALIINPWGFEYIKFLLHATTMDRPSIAEWQGIFSFLQKKHLYIYKFFLFFIVIIELFKDIMKLKNFNIVAFYHNIDKVKVIVLVVTAYLSIIHMKMIPFFCIAAACYCYEDVVKLFSKVNQKAIYILLIILSVFTLAFKKFELPINFKKYPVTELEFIRQNEIKGNILVDFALGSYTSYKLYPHNKIYMDGRYEEVYPDELLTLLSDFYASKAGWDKILKKYPPDIIVIDRILPVFKLMEKNPDWRLVFVGNAFGVFIRNSIYKGDYILPPMQRDYYKDTLFDTDIKFSR